MAQAIPITFLKENEEGIIHSVSGGKAFNIRLAGMGVVPGIRVKVLRNRGGRMIVMASDTQACPGQG